MAESLRKKWWAWQGLNLRPLRCQHRGKHRNRQKRVVFASPNSSENREQNGNRLEFHRNDTGAQNRAREAA